VCPEEKIFLPAVLYKSVYWERLHLQNAEGSACHAAGTHPGTAGGSFLALGDHEKICLLPRQNE
jgi:hypothetical protein